MFLIRNIWGGIFTWIIQRFYKILCSTLPWQTIICFNFGVIFNLKKDVDIINQKYAILLKNLHNKAAANYIKTKQYDK